MNNRLSKNLISYHWLLWLFLFLLGALVLIIYQNFDFSIIVNAFHNNFLDQFFKYVTFLGDGRFVFLIAFIFLIVNKKFGTSLLISLLINTIFIQVLKRVIFSNQFRPSFYFKSLIDNGSWNMIDGVELYEKFSFPSGHTASAFCLCISLCFFIKKKYYLLILVFLAYLVGFSRIYLSQHFLIDVLTGALIGSLIPLLTHTYIDPLIFDKKKLKFKMNFLKNNLKPILFYTFYACLLMFSTIGDFNLFDWDEINFAESSREMLVSNNFSQVMINFEPFHEKPPLFFWLQVLSFKIFGVSSFAARFPNALLSIIIPVLLFKIGSQIKNTTFGWIWSIIFIAGFLPNLYFRTGIIDPYFNLFIFLSIYFFFIYSKSHHLKHVFLSSFFAGLAILTKGPVGLLIVLLSCFTYQILNNKKVPLKHVFLFFVMVVLVSSPWYFFELLNKGPWFIVEFLQYQIELFSHPVAGHQQPIYYHFVIVLIGCLPFSFFAFKNAFKDSGSGIPFEKMMRIVLWVVLILFTIVTTKIVHYSSMAYLPLSFLGSIEIYKLYSGKSFNRFLKYSLFIIGVFIGIILMFSFYVLIHKKEFLINSINDLYIQNLLDVELYWFGWEWIIPSLFILGSFIWLTIVKSKILFSLFFYSLIIGLLFSLLSKFIVPNVENLIQGSAVSFFREISNEKKYLTTVGYKSYAHYFYSELDELKLTDSLHIKKNDILRQKFESNSLNDLDRKEKSRLNSHILSWLINGEVDRVVYFATKNNKPIKQLENAKNLEVVKNFGGYKIYKRQLK